MASYLKKSRAKARKKAGEPVRKRPEEHGETCLQMHCRAWLERSGLWARLLIFHVPNERRGGPGTGLYFKRMGVRPGVADWLAFIPGRAVAIELKDEDGKQSEAQERFQKDWEKAGNTYLLARTLEEFQGIINAIALFV